MALVGGQETLHSPLRKRLEQITSGALWAVSVTSVLSSLLADPADTYDPSLPVDGCHEPDFKVSTQHRNPKR